MTLSFSELWEQCEQLHQKNNNISIIIDELLMKLNLYKLLDDKVTTDDQQIVKSRLLGEILLTITKISLQDNINVFGALVTAYNFHKN